MATKRIPDREGIRQLNRGDVFGELWATKNIDLHTNPGKLKLARPFKQVVTASTLDDNIVHGFAMLGSGAYALTDSDLYEASSPFTSWSEQNTGAGVDDVAVQNAQDITVFESHLVISTTDDLDAWDGDGSSDYISDWWTARGNPSLQTHSPPSNVVPHIMEVVRIGAETLAVTDGSQVHAYTGGIESGAVSSVTVDIDSVFTSCCLKSSIRKVWIGTYSENADQAYVFEWDGASTNYTQAFPVGAKAVLSMELIDNVPIIVTERGEIKAFNNAGFTTVARFPFATKPLFADGVETGLIQDNNPSRPIHPKGMKREGNTVFITTAWEAEGDDVPIDERTPAGLWALDITNWSLTHLGSPENESHFQDSSPLMVINDDATRIFMGGRRNVSSDEEGIWIEDLDDDTENYGYFVTTEMESESVLDLFDHLYTKALLGDEDEIVVKYRTERDTSYPIVVEDVVWASSTQFHTTSDISHVLDRFNENEKNRDEVEVILGSGAGRLAHITNIEKSSTVYQVTIDEEIGTASETADVRFDNWRKIPETYTNTSGEKKKLGVNASGTWCQVKVELRGKAGLPEVRQLMLHSNNKESI